MKLSRKKLKNLNQQQQEEFVIQWIRNAMPEIKEEDIYIKDGNIHISNESLNRQFKKGMKK
jgi:predicted nucleotide-binding protein (sugar kinase/HSP70/actin superfamily)